jgi:hypothetical protein
LHCGDCTDAGNLDSGNNQWITSKISWCFTHVGDIFAKSQEPGSAPFPDLNVSAVDSGRYHLMRKL